jgi:hypothetical protein
VVVTKTTMRRTLFLVTLLLGCASGDPEVGGDECFVETTKEAVRSCYPSPLEPELDPEHPDYGRVPCVVIDAGRAGSPYCDCDQPGFGPASAAQAELAREQLDAGGICEGGCCENLCFCELFQLSGDSLDHCQGRNDTEYPPGNEPRGWCYVEPGRGLGHPSTVEDCPGTQQQKILFVPPEVLANHHVAVFACVL